MQKKHMMVAGIVYFPGTNVDIDAYYDWLQPHFERVEIVGPQTRRHDISLLVIPHFNGYDVTSGAFSTGLARPPINYPAPPSSVKWFFTGQDFSRAVQQSDLEFYFAKEETTILAEQHACFAVLEGCYQGKLECKNGYIAEQYRNKALEDYAVCNSMVDGYASPKFIGTKGSLNMTDLMISMVMQQVDKLSHASVMQDLEDDGEVVYE